MIMNMTDIKKDNRGYLYPNNNKNKPTQPDHTGKITIEGKEWRLSAWENKSPDGKKYLSINVSPPLDNQNVATPGGQPIQKKLPVADSSSQNDISKDDLEDLDAILKLTDDENPFD